MMIRLRILVLMALAASACAGTPSPSSAEMMGDRASCDAVELSINLYFDGQMAVNGQPTDLDGVREAARRKGSACRGADGEGTISTAGGNSRLLGAVWAIVGEEAPSVSFDRPIIVSGGTYPDERLAFQTHQRSHTRCRGVWLNVVVTDDDHLFLNGRDSSLDTVRMLARNIGFACDGAPVHGALGSPRTFSDLRDDIEAMLFAEIPNLVLEYSSYEDGRYVRLNADGTPLTADPGDRQRITITSGVPPGLLPADPIPTINPENPSCSDTKLDIVVTDDETLVLNGGLSTLAQLRRAAQVKARVCEGETPTGTYEGPNHVTVMASMIWPILNEELPNLELRMCNRGPGGRGLFCEGDEP